MRGSIVALSVMVASIFVCATLDRAQEPALRARLDGAAPGAESAPPTLPPVTVTSLPGDTCRGSVVLGYPQSPASSRPGDTVRVAIVLGAGLIRGGTTLFVNRLRFALDCNSSSPGIGCADDGPVVSYQGGLTTTCGVAIVADHERGDVLPNQVIFTPVAALAISAGTRSFCRVEFDVRIESPSNDLTPEIIEQVVGFDLSQGDGVCNTARPLATGGRDSGEICLGPGCETLGASCEPLLDLTYPESPNLLRVGETARARITFGGGHTSFGVPVVVHQLRFDLDCNNASAGINCPDDGGVVSYQGRLSTTCPVAFTCSHSPGDNLPNQVVFTPSSPLLVPADTPSFCDLDFDIRTESRSNDGTPDTIEQAFGVDDSQGDALCDVSGRSRSGEDIGNGFLQLCPTCSDGNPCNGIETCDSNVGCVPGTPLACNDGNACTDDSCDPVRGCVFVPNGSCGEGRKGIGYWKRLCRGPHPSGDFYVPGDVACVAEACPFSDVRTIEDLCDILAPARPNDPCAKAEAQLMALELNVCRGFVSDGDAIHRSCGSATTIGEARARTEALLCDPARTPATCRAASCTYE
jgi:hypothetical protein